MQTTALTPDACLDAERDAAVALLQCLRREQECLIAADIDALSTLTAQKSELVRDAAQFEQQRQQALRAAGFATDAAGMRQWLQQAGARQRQAWEELLALAASARELNRSNGILIHTHLARNRELLTALQGEAAGGVYGPGGQPSLGSASRRLVVG